MRKNVSIAATLTALVALAVPAAFARVPVRHTTVAIVDTGVTPNKALAARMVPGWNLASQSADTRDATGHGTQLAHIVADRCPRCLIMPVRVANSGFGDATLAAQGIRYAVAHGAGVINLSLTTFADDPDLDAAIADAVALGVTTVVAAGNGGAPVGYPGVSVPQALTVGSVDPDGSRYPWSNYGPWVKVEAPGVLPTRNLLGARTTAVGTSASAAFVSGAVGQLLACRPGQSPAAVQSQVQQYLYSSPC